MNMPKNTAVGLRWGIALLLVIGSLTWLYNMEQSSPFPRTDSSVHQPKALADLPTVQGMAHLDKVLTIVTNLPEQRTHVAGMDSSLFFAADHTRQTATAPEQQHIVVHDLRLLFTTPSTSYALYQGQFIKPGDTLAQGDKVLRITQKGVSLFSKVEGKVKRIPWQAPNYVEFTKAPAVPLHLTKSSQQASDQKTTGPRKETEVKKGTILDQAAQIKTIQRKLLPDT